MTSKSLSAKQRILTATISLIMENKDASQIPISSIAERAGVGIGLINYHFQTKENLINQCVQQVIGQLFGSFEVISDKLEHLQPADRLEYVINFIAEFMINNPELSRISTLSDLSWGKENDNSDNVMKVYYPLIKSAFEGTKDEKQLRVILQILISTVQVAFLRREVNIKVAGFDFFDEEHRKEFIAILIDLFRK